MTKMTDELFNSWVDYKIERGSFKGNDGQRVGLRIRVKTRTEIEDYMRLLSNDKRTLAEAYADQWVNCKPDTQLEVYMTENLMKGASQKVYTLDGIGQQLIIFGPKNVGPQPIRRGIDIGLDAPQTNQDGVINLSFLRTVGISDDEGIAIGFPGAFSKDYVDTLRQQLPQLTRQFLQDFIVPITINLQIISRS